MILLKKLRKDPNGIYVSSQEEWDAVHVNTGEPVYIVPNPLDYNKIIIVNTKENNVIVTGGAVVHLYASASVQSIDSVVEAFNNSVVSAGGTSTVYAADYSQVIACGDSVVSAYGESTVEAYDCVKVELFGDFTQVSATDNVSVVANGSSEVFAYGYVEVVARDRSKVYAYNNAVVEAEPGANVSVFDYASMRRIDKQGVKAR